VQSSRIQSWALATPSSSSPIIVTETLTRSGISPSSLMNSRAMEAEVLRSPLVRSLVIQSLSSEAIEVVIECSVGRPTFELTPKIRTRHPTRSPSMRHDIGDRLAVDGEDNPLACPDRVDDLTHPISQISNLNVHGCHRRTLLHRALGLDPAHVSERSSPVHDAHRTDGASPRGLRRLLPEGTVPTTAATARSSLQVAQFGRDDEA